MSTPTSAPQALASPLPQARLTVLARPHWVNALVLRPAARPYLRLDGVEHALDWGVARTFPVEAGTHQLETFWRYRGFQAPLGTGTLRVPVREREQVFVLARNGPLNHQPLRPRRSAPF